MLAIAGVAVIPGLVTEGRPPAEGARRPPAGRPNHPAAPHHVQRRAAPSATDTKKPWPTGPNGSRRRTGRAGTRYDRGLLGNELPTEPCAPAQRFWAMKGECQVVDAGARKVGVVVRPTDDDRFDQWAAYRHPDGVVVFVAQSGGSNGGPTELTKLPFSVEQLAALATDDRFHLE
ncbi:hypothetical protein [Micromonospora sp. KC723]|uniref:hypothetical protein n=1 Tax=Micromonospora sp. KC723 TaxID=2530381 RepID=UPI001FB84158|nr:hypothetical protein [Micromonospora sp. KC723]